MKPAEMRHPKGYGPGRPGFASIVGLVPGPPGRFDVLRRARPYRRPGLGVGMNVTFRPIDEWPDSSVDPHSGPRSVSRERSLFRSSWSQTLELLEYELYRLGADSVVISMALGSEDIRQDGWPRKRSRPSHPGVILEFQTRDGWQRYYGDDYDRWEHNVHDIAKLLEDLRAVGLRRAARGKQYQGFKEIESPGTSANVAQELLDSYGGLREALKATHPDRGGDPEEFRRVQEARELLGL